MLAIAADGSRVRTEATDRRVARLFWCHRRPGICRRL